AAVYVLFLADDVSARRGDAGECLESAESAGRRYGTLRSELQRHIDAGNPVVLEIEVQGARQVRSAMPEAVQIFIEPPDGDALKDRLVGRGTDDPDAIARRLAVADEEIAAADEFQYRVVNDRLDEAVARLVEI